MGCTFVGGAFLLCFFGGSLFGGSLFGGSFVAAPCKPSYYFFFG